jgi:hypothetical protein
MCCSLPSGRQTYRKFGERSRLAVDRDRAAMLLRHDVVGDRQAKPRALTGLTTPLISHHPESISKHGDLCEHSGEPLDQRQQSRVGHIGDQIVEHAALPEQRVSAPLGGV